VTERPYQVGDKITIDDDHGEVTDIDLRATTLRTPDDSAVSVPNATMFTANVSNANNGQPEMMVVVELAVTASADVERVSAIVKEAMMTSKYVYVDDDHPFVGPDRGRVLLSDDSRQGVCGRRARRVRIRLRRDRALDGRLRQRRGRNARGARSRLRTHR